MFQIPAGVLLEHVFHENEAVSEGGANGKSRCDITDRNSALTLTCLNSSLQPNHILVTANVLDASVTVSTSCDEMICKLWILIA